MKTKSIALGVMEDTVHAAAMSVGFFIMVLCRATDVHRPKGAGPYPKEVTIQMMWNTAEDQDN